MRKILPLLLGGGVLLAACGGPVPDTVPPTVTLSLGATTVQAPATVTLTATATDNVGVTSVQFFRGSESLGSGTRSGNTHTRTVNVTAADAGQRVFRVVATDAAGNRAEASATLTVTAPANTTVVSGVVVEDETGAPWEGGSGRVFAVSGTNVDVVLSEGTLTSTGAFTVTLPQPTAGQLSTWPTEFFQPNGETLGFALTCDATTVNTTNLPRVLPAEFTVETDTRFGFIVPVRANESAQGVSSVFGSYLYAEQDTTVSGQTNCQTQVAPVGAVPVVFTYNMALRQGWNAVRTTVEADFERGRVNVLVTVGEVPGQWLFFPDGGEAGPLSILNKRF